MLEQLGLTATSAITLFYQQIIHRRGLPFELRLPNATTRRAMRDARTGRGVMGARSMEELFAKLDVPERKTRPRSKRRRVQSSR
jgi:DNA-damage-inducible protein J